MCMFPFPNKNIDGEAYKKGVVEFGCGCCPECLAERARLWALRCSAEAQKTRGIMVTLTYDDYKYDRSGRAVGELPPDGLLPLNKRHCQLFIKRVRAHFKGVKIKYLLTAERGKRTNRAHYHAILFGVDFSDKVPYKRSDRGNMIYKSATLTRLWGHGICTIDAVKLNAQVARYCTKYCAKDSRADETFMLVSRGIGDEWLTENFNGKSYILDGREYTIPRQIWNKYIAKKYANNYIFNLRGADYRYRSLKWYLEKFGDNTISRGLAELNQKSRRYFRRFRDSNFLYKRYLQYWQDKAKLFELTRPPILQRILALPNKKYFSYKQAALACIASRVERWKIADDISDWVLPPRYLSQYRKLKALDKYRICPISCHNRANDSTDQRKRFRAFLIDSGIAPPLPKLVAVSADEKLQSPF